ncbi:MAG: 50S ribosomal protein L3 [Methanomassiliicoccales archaeon]|nr:MAG: 50S ribosomal protein L3 [Methanomassiliicoccales archaeon]
MPDTHHPKRGSKGYSPRKRARSHIPRFKTWPEREGEPKIQGFAGYKAGMTHAFIMDYRKTSTTSKQEVRVPVTVIEVPPMKVAAVRLYENTSYGLKTLGEVWAGKVEKELERRLPIPKNYEPKEAWKKIDTKDVDDVRLLVYTQPKKVGGVPKKTPELMEVRIGGGTIKERLRYAKKVMGKEVKITEFTTEGEMVDVASITKGKGFQGHVKRWGVKLLHHKNSKHRRMIGTLGPWNPHFVHTNVPQAGQMGYHQRTEYNKRVLKLGENGEEITPNGGFVRYGFVKNEYMVVHGSIPGPVKRLVRFRDSVRFHGTAVEKPEITYISTESKQGA